MIFSQCSRVFSQCNAVQNTPDTAKNTALTARTLSPFTPTQKMSRIVKSGLIQMSLPITEGEGTIAEIMEAMVQKHIPLIEEAGRQGVQILCLQEIFNTPYFCPRAG